MPIEIRELHIKAVVEPGGSSGDAATSTAGGEKTDKQSEQNTEQLIELCVEKIMEVIKEKNER